MNFKPLINKESLLKYITDLDIYRFYTGQDVVFNGNIKSPLKKDNKPSFGYFKGTSGEICFKDFRIGSGDCIKFVQYKFNLNFFQALSKIATDFNLEDKFLIDEMPKSHNQFTNKNSKSRAELLSTIEEDKTIGIKSRSWQPHDKKFWSSYGVSKQLLLNYGVIPIEYFFVGSKIFKADKYAYAFREFKDGVETYKIYQPFSDGFKWITNQDSSIWHGWAQLPQSGMELIITKSLKDTMAIRNILGVPSVSLQNEGIVPKENIVQELKDRFILVYLLFDNDFDKSPNIGREKGTQLCKDLGLLRLEIPDNYKSKDFSDLVFNYGREKANKIFNNIFKIPF